MHSLEFFEISIIQLCRYFLIIVIIIMGVLNWFWTNLEFSLQYHLSEALETS